MAKGEVSVTGRRTVSCLLGAPVKTIVSTQLTHWLAGPGRCAHAGCNWGGEASRGGRAHTRCAAARHRRHGRVPGFVAMPGIFTRSSLIQWRQKCPYRALLASPSSPPPPPPCTALFHHLPSSPSYNPPFIFPRVADVRAKRYNIYRRSIRRNSSREIAADIKRILVRRGEHLWII